MPKEQDNIRKDKDNTSKDKRTIELASEIIEDIPKNFNKNIKKMNIPKWFEKLSALNFLHILLIWLTVITLFGMTYFFFSTNSSYLLHNVEGTKVNTLEDSVYFSIVTATSTGFGDIVPMGAFKVIVTFEIVFGLLLLAFVTSKLISLKQDVILNEIYEISFHERINELRSSLLVFRQNLTRIIGKIEEKKLKKKELKELNTYISPLEIGISEISIILGRKGDSHFTKNIDPLNAELIFTSTLQSIEKVTELICALNENIPGWRKEITLPQLENCILLADNLFNKAEKSKILPKENITNLKTQKDIVIKKLKEELNRK